MNNYVPNELALVRSTIQQADSLVELLSEEENDQSQLLDQIQSILREHEAGVDLLIELRKKLEANAELYKERAKAIRKYAETMERAKDFVDTSIIAMSNELGNRLEGSVEALCIENNPVKVECLVDLTDAALMEELCAEYPFLFVKEVSVTYSYNKGYAKSNQDKDEVHQYFDFSQGKHIRVRRSTNPKSLPKS